MATLRELVPGIDASLSGLVPGSGPSPIQRTLRDPNTALIEDQAAAGSMGQLRRGFNSGLLSGDANALAAGESVARAAGRTADADALRQRITAIQGRAATFAPTEQDVTKLGWEPGRITDWALGAAGQGAASMLEPAGAAAGLGVASRVLGAVPTAPTRLLGGALRLAAPAAAGYLGYRQNKGEFYNDAVDDPALMAGRTPQEIDNAGTFHGAVAGALDTMLPALAGERIAGRAGMRALAKAGVPAKIGLDLAGEGVTETLQGEVKRGTLGHLNPLRDTGGDTADRWNDFAGGIVGAGPLSAASHLAGKGHARLDVVDDPSNDVSGKKGAAPAAPPARENLAGSLKRRAKEIDQDDAAEAWNEVLKGVGTDDPETAYPQRHAALLKELGGRAEKGDTTAKQHLDTLSAMDPADPVSWYDDSPRDAAYQHLMGDGMDHAKVLGAYKARKLNAQGSGEPSATAKLAASIMQDAAPEKAPGTAEDLADPKDVAEHLAHQIADFASRPKAKFGDNVALFYLADDMVGLYGFEGAKAVLAKVATAVGVEKTPMFKQLQGNLVRSDYAAFKQGQRKQRGLAAGELAAALPPEAHLALRDKGVDLTTAGGRMALLEVMQSYANGKLDRKRVEMNALLGGKEVVDKLLDMVAPGKVEEKTEVDTPKKSGGEKTAPAKPSDELSEPDDWEVDGALKNIEKAPGTKLYLFKGKQAVGSTESAHPFVPDKKTKNLPTLSSLDDRNKDGNNTLEMMQANAYTGLGGSEFGNERTRVIETIAGPMRPGEARKTRATTTESAPMQDIESAVPGTQGVGSHRIRTVSAREVMDHHGVKGGERVKIMRAYLARGDKPVMSEDDPTIQQISTLDRKINARIGETPKVLTTGVAKGGAPMPTVDNPRYLELKDLQGQRREAMTKLAAKIGVDVSEDATVEDLANAYFAGRFLVVAEQMAEKDGLRLDVAEVRKMMRRGNDDLNYSDQFKADGTQAEVQADMNLIRFPSKNAVSKDGIGVIRAGDLVEWVFANRTTFNKKDYSSDVTHAHDFRDALVEGIGALAADGFMTSLPFMINAKGQVESFADGFPPSLRLSGLTQAELDKRKAKRVAEVTEMVGPPDLEATAREQSKEPKSDNDKSVPEEFRHPGAERGAADKRTTDEPNGLKERFWDAPEMEDTRSDESLVPSQTEPRKQAKGVPTERTDIAQRTEVLGSAASGIETLTMANAVRKAEAIAASMWEALGFQMKTQVVNGVLVEADPKRDVKADPRTGRDRLERMVAALRPGSAPVAPLLSRAEAEKLAAGAKDPSASLAKLTALRQPGQGAVVAGGRQYAAPLAHLLTPAHVARLVATAKNGTKAKADLELMRSKVADALADMKDEGFSRADITALARLLTGNEKLTPSLATAALEKMAWPARMVRKAEREAATKKAAPMKATPEVPASRTRAEAAAHQAKVDAPANAAKIKESYDEPDHTKVLAYLAGKLKTGGRDSLKDFLAKATVPQLLAARDAIQSFEDRSEDQLGVGAPKWGMAEAQIEEEIYERAPSDVLQAEAAKSGRKFNSMSSAHPALDPALKAVAKTRSLMSMLGFKTAPAQFADLAAKLLTDPRQDVSKFIAESAEALSHVLMAGASGDAIRAALDSNVWHAERARIVSRLIGSGLGGKDARNESFRVLTERVIAGELAPSTPNERSVLRQLIDAAKGFVNSFKKMAGSPEFADVVREQLNALVERAGTPAEIKAGFKKVSFQEAVDADPAAAAVLVHMTKNPNISLTGSIVLAHNGTVYRNASNMLHDLDFVVTGTKEAAEAHLRKAFPGAEQVSDFSTSKTSGRVNTFIVPPPGATVSGITRQFGDKGGVTGYTITKDGKQIGRKWADESGERREGEAGTIIDFFTESANPPATTTIPFTAGGATHAVRAQPAASIFDQKLSMGREKDISDFVRYVPTAGSKLNAQSTAQAAPTDTQIAEAKAYLTKTLGPKVIVEFSKDFTNAGEWVEAENLIRLSTAIGPGVLSVAHHEALHAFWSRAIKSHPGAVEALKRVLADGDIYERMKAMLANEPAALASMAADPEERVAYAFQFWAAGQLDVDKPATTLFAKFRKALRKVLGMVRDSEVALDLMTALHDGKLAEPSAAGRVIDGILKAQTWNEDFKRKFDRQVQGIHAAVSTSNDVLRKEVLSPTAQRLGLTMFTNPGEQSDGKFKEGYINARNRKIRQYTNYLYAALKGLSERDMVAATEYLQNPDTKASDIPYAPVRKAVEAVRALTKRYYDYATNDAGMTLEYLGDNHFPRVWDLSKLIEEGGKDKFVAMLMQPKYAKTMASALDLANANVSSAAPKATLADVAEGMYRHLVDKNGVDEKGLDGEREANALLSPFFASQKERSFKWLDAEDVKPFLEKDLVGAMSRYLHQGIRAAEYARRFGEGGKDLRELLAMKGDDWINPDTDRKEQRPAHGKIAAEMEDAIKAKGIKGKEAEQMLARHMEDIKNSVAAHEGSLGNDITPTFRKWSSAAMAYQNLRLLPMSLFAAFGDVMGIAAHGAGGKATFEAFTQGLKDVYLRWKDAASDVPEARAKSVWEGIAEMIGAVDSHMFLEQMGKAHTSEFMTDFARKANRALFMANGLTAWDRSMRVSATKAAVLFLQDHASLPDKQHSKRWLAEIGLAASDIPLDADGKLIVDRHVLAATKGIPIEQATAQMERVHYALTRWVEGAVLTPNAGQRPTWASDPHYAVLFHLKQFTYSFHHTILKRAFNEASSGNMNPIGALAAAVPTMIAADMVKGVVVGGGELPAYMKAWDAGDWVLHGASRAGLGGVGQFGIDALRDPFSVMGPTVDQVANFVFNPTDILHNIHDAIPGARMIKGVPDLARVAG